MFINDTKKKSVWNKNPVFCSPLHSSHPLCFLFFFSSLSLSHSQCNRHENELLICFPKEIPHATQAWQPQYDGCCVVNKQFSWASLPLKGTFSSGPDHVKNVVVKGFSAFLLTQRCQMERVRISKHVNPCERKLGPLPPQRSRVHSAC